MQENTPFPFGFLPFHEADNGDFGNVAPFICEFYWD